MNFIKDEKNNIIYYSNEQDYSAIKINFQGQNNIVFIPNYIREVTYIEFRGNNSLVFLCSGARNARIVLHSDCVCYIGKNSFMGTGTIWISECKNFIMGDDCLFSFNLFFRTTDQHMIYDALSHKRINQGKSVYIGDHCWCGYECSILKGCFLASGLVIGNRSVVTGKNFYSNTINVGSPCKEVKKNIFWIKDTPDKDFVDKNILEKYENYQDDKFKYFFNPKEFLSPKLIERNIQSFTTPYEKLSYLYNNLYMNTNKNRFSLDKEENLENFLPQKQNDYFKDIEFFQVIKTGGGIRKTA